LKNHGNGFADIEKSCFQWSRERFSMAFPVSFSPFADFARDVSPFLPFFGRFRPFSIDFSAFLRVFAPSREIFIVFRPFSAYFRPFSAPFPCPQSGFQWLSMYLALPS